MALLKVENLSAGYGGQKIVEDVSFELGEGETAAIFGENGSGKTTLLRGIAGLGTRISGTVYVSGRNVTDMRTRARAGYLAMSACEAEVPEGLLADEVLEMGWYARLPFPGVPDRNMREEKQKLIRELELEPLLPAYFNKLSQGQKQRVLLGRMLMQDTPVFLMDEPDSGLDFRHKHALLRKMGTMARERKKAGIMILHDPSLALTYCDRVFLIKGGRIADVISPGEESETQIAEKIQEITGRVRVTKQGISVIISPGF